MVAVVVKNDKVDSVSNVTDEMNKISAKSKNITILQRLEI